MTFKKDGGPAFPRGDYHPNGDGMSLRDWFAGQALAGLIGRSVAATVLTCKTIDAAWAIADAMLAVREAEASQ